MIELRRIEAAKDIADKMSRSRNVVYLPSGNQMLMGLGTGGATN
jgi:prohibitin 1